MSEQRDEARVGERAEALREQRAHLAHRGGVDAGDRRDEPTQTTVRVAVPVLAPVQHPGVARDVEVEVADAQSLAMVMLMYFVQLRIAHLSRRSESRLHIPASRTGISCGSGRVGSRTFLPTC
jgi:hypothetical protein